MKNDYQIIIIGSGVIGLSIAKSLSKKNYKSVLVIEKEDSYGKGISSRNSEVIHSGVYYKKYFKIKAMYRRQQKLSRFVKNIPFGIKNVEN